MDVIQVQDIGKLYQLGEVGTGTLSHDLNRWWAKLQGKEDPRAKVGHVNDRTLKGGRHDYVWALNDINFSVQQGELVGVIGKNGSGKSSLLKIISRITAPTKGNIKIRGRVASLLEVGTGFHSEMTGRENIFMNGTLMGMTRKEIQSKFDDIVDFAGIARYVDTPVKRYSSGMTVRLGFAVAAFLEPEILIVDEVLAVGDADFQNRCLGKMQDVSVKEGRTVLFVSHNMSAVLKLCPRSILLQNGNLIADGLTDKVVSQYLSSDANKKGEYLNNTSILPTSQKLKIRQGRLLKCNNMVYHEFEIQDEMFLEISFEILIPGSRYSVGFELNSVQHGIIFSSTIFDNDIEQLYTRQWDIGLHTYLVKMPNSLLRSGDYHITITSAIPNLEVLDIAGECLSFSIVDRSSPIVKSNEARRGAILPILPWTKSKRTSFNHSRK
jgi:lipopolysaccharide transport system ATP-binding protein